MDWNLELDLDEDAEAPTRAQIERKRNDRCLRCGAPLTWSAGHGAPVCSALLRLGHHRDKAE